MHACRGERDRAGEDTNESDEVEEAVVADPGGRDLFEFRSCETVVGLPTNATSRRSR